jgi:putative transposase
MATPLRELTAQARARAMERFNVLRPFLEEHVELRHSAHQPQLSRRTLRRWLQRYATEGLAGLIRKRRADRGGRRRLSSTLQPFVAGLALQTPPLSVAVIHRKACELAQPQAMRLPSYSLVYDIVRQLPPALTPLAHQGTKGYNQRFALLHRRAAEAPNEIGQADHCLLDSLLVREGQSPAKPWLTVVLDDYSRAMAGYFLPFDAPSALNTSLALRQAIWRQEDPQWHICGIPQVFYTDCGSDCTSQHLAQVSVDLKIRLTNSIPGQPRGRGRIERFFKTVQQMLLGALAGYAPPHRPVRGHPALTLSELATRVRAFVFGVYHVRPHSETPLPPQPRWEAGGGLPQMPASLAQLALLLLTGAKPRTIRRDGSRVLGQRYMAPTLAAYVGASVLLRSDPRDVAEVRVFSHDRFLWRARCQALAGATVPLRDIIKARNRHRRDLRQPLRDRAQGVESL